MSFYTKNHPMLGSDSVFNAWKSRRQAATFKGTLFGIMVSFFIIIFLAYLLNLAENFQAETQYNMREASELKTERASDEASGVSWNWRQFLGIKTVQAATPLRPSSAQGSGKAQQGSAGQATKAVKNNYEALAFINSASQLELLPGEDASYRIGFKNTGLKPWLNTGANFVSIYTYSPKYRKSVFSNGWFRAAQPVKLQQKKVNPGEIGYFEFKVKAPKATGAYTENFRLAAENKAWIVNGDFSIPILVVAKKNALGKAVMPASSELKTASPIVKAAAAVSKPFTASLLLKSREKIEAKAGEIVDMRLVYKNAGAATWDLAGLIVPEEALEEDGKSVFFYPTWPSGHQPSVLGVTATGPGETIFLDFKIRAPEAGGTYVLKLKLVANYNQEVADGMVEIPMTVASEGAVDTTVGRVKNALNMAEPQIEVGLQYFSADAPQTIEIMGDKAYELRDKSGNLLANFSAAEPAAINYDFSGKIFTVRNARINSQYSGELHFKATDGQGIFTILSMSRPTAYGHNDNQYRGEIILRQAETTGRLWLINRLPMEQYLYGIAETSNGAPAEFIKANIVAARTYALYHYLNPYKYNGYFTVQWTTADQYYRGYGSELRRPAVVKAVDDTKGQVVTYEGDVVVTPYFGHSDGRTRSWSEAWGGKDKPWIKSVSAPYDAGLAMFGHGIGMSQNDAANRAKTDLWDYTKILKYYYNGIEVSKVY